MSICSLEYTFIVSISLYYIVQTYEAHNYINCTALQTLLNQQITP